MLYKVNLFFVVWEICRHAHLSLSLSSVQCPWFPYSLQPSALCRAGRCFQYLVQWLVAKTSVIKMETFLLRVILPNHGDCCWRANIPHFLMFMVVQHWIPCRPEFTGVTVECFNQGLHSYGIPKSGNARSLHTTSWKLHHTMICPESLAMLEPIHFRLLG